MLGNFFRKRLGELLELDAKEFATFIAALYILDREKIEKYYDKHLEVNIHDILMIGKSTMEQAIENIYNRRDFIISSDIIKNILEGEELK